MTDDSFLVIAYPQDAAEAAALARRLATALQEACRAPPVIVRPNVTALCLLARGDFADIKTAVDGVTDAYSRWLVVKVGTPFEAHGLSTAAQWLGRSS